MKFCVTVQSDSSMYYCHLSQEILVLFSDTLHKPMFLRVHKMHIVFS